MAPVITAWRDLIHLNEKVHRPTGQFECTTFAAVTDDDTVYFGKLYLPICDITFEQITCSLAPIPDRVLYPRMPLPIVGLTQAPEAPVADVYIKRAAIALFDLCRDHQLLRLIPDRLLEEAKIMERLSRHPHPNIIRYHGCRVRRDRITGLVLDSYAEDTLADYVQEGRKLSNKETFMQALESAVHHLHSLGWAHNDLKPHHVLIKEGEVPVLIEFGCSRPFGTRLDPKQGFVGWIAAEMQDFHVSDKRNDLFALGLIRVWLDYPIFG